MYRTATALALFSSLTLLAQSLPSTAGSGTSSTQDHSTAAAKSVPSPNLPATIAFAGGCPVSMDARQGIWDHTIRVRNGKNEKAFDGFGQRISLTLVDIHTQRIIAAKVKVLGLSGHNRMLNTSAVSGSQPDASRIIKLTSFSEEKNGVTADLYAPGFTAVTSIQLLEIIYANGSTWSSSSSTVCRIAPDPLMLVAEH